ncbi:MAG: hypothetical protein U9R47_05790 [Actinomycetota bacterium]|nr:hypothetical protein [Actinomycetota bacterium]
MDEYEEIPWSTLLTEHRQGRAKTLYMAAAVIVAIVVGFVGIRWLTAPGHGDQPALAAAVETTTTSEDAVIEAESPSTTTTAVLSEADLMAPGPAVAELAAVARAEWFVTDYFTVDGPIPEELISAFVNDAAIPDLPDGEGNGISYVEWARAFDVRPTTGGYAVSVVFRSLTEEPDGAFVRGPVRAVDVLIAVEEGETAIAELPIPILPPVYHAIEGWMVTSGEAHDQAITATLDYAGMFDERAEVIESGAAGPEWRVVFTIGDRSGNRWPVVMRSDTIPGA